MDHQEFHRHARTVSGIVHDNLIQQNKTAKVLAVTDYLVEQIEVVRRNELRFDHDALIDIAKDSKRIEYYYSQRQKINAIKHLRLVTRSSLKEAKDAVEEAFDWNKPIDAWSSTSPEEPPF